MVTVKEVLVVMDAMHSFTFGCIGMNTKMLNDIGESSWFCAVCSKEMI